MYIARNRIGCSDNWKPELFPLQRVDFFYLSRVNFCRFILRDREGIGGEKKILGEEPYIKNLVTMA